MLVTNIRIEDNQVAATVEWEDSRRERVDIFVRGDNLVADPNGFLLLCYLPAWKSGEKRLKIDGEICPVLRANMSAASQSIARWHGMVNAPDIVATNGSREPSKEVAIFLSGGVDSLASLRASLARVPSSHPEALSAAILVAGTTSDAKFEGLKKIQKIITGDVGVEAIALRTNAQELHGNDIPFYMHVYHGAFLSGLAHFLSNRLRTARISATFDAANLEPWGSHPLLDPFYSSAHMTIEHHGLEMSRFQKTEAIADWPIALKHMNVCTSRDVEGENCGRCEKCRRTMLALLSMGKLGAADAFPKNDLQPSDLADLYIGNAYQASCYRDLLVPLRRVGRDDLAKAIETKLNPGLLLTTARRIKRRFGHSKSAIPS